jgi:hypothetical protein
MRVRHAAVAVALGAAAGLWLRRRALSVPRLRRTLPPPERPSEPSIVSVVDDLLMAPRAA